ncbi:hypothetical protein [Falsochrobactrum shanghaiense]|uniref:hypothetical protein n=1 Tax=Falsochrobactrum shanghaiense TaxID=2201899 RepID=UPI001FE0627C|nr:hypothetical protein [Falsochrobactrum shanghaiense]
MRKLRWNIIAPDLGFQRPTGKGMRIASCSEGKKIDACYGRGLTLRTSQRTSTPQPDFAATAIFNRSFNFLCQATVIVDCFSRQGKS